MLLQKGPGPSFILKTLSPTSFIEKTENVIRSRFYFVHDWAVRNTLLMYGRSSLCCLQGTGTRFDFALGICFSFPFNHIGGDEEGGSGVQGGLSLLSPTHGRPGPRLGAQSLPGATILFSAIRLLSVFIKDIGVQWSYESILSKNNHVEMRGLIIKGSLRFA